MAVQLDMRHSHRIINFCNHISILLIPIKGISTTIRIINTRMNFNSRAVEYLLLKKVMIVKKVIIFICNYIHKLIVFTK